MKARGQPAARPNSRAALEAFARTALRAGRDSEVVEVRPRSGSGLGRHVTRWAVSQDGVLELITSGRVVVTRRRHVFGRVVERLGRRLGWISWRQREASRAFIHALLAEARDAQALSRALADEGVRPDRPVNARQVLRLTPTVVHRMEFSPVAMEPGPVVRQWHYARQVVLKLKAFLAPR